MWDAGRSEFRHWTTYHGEWEWRHGGEIIVLSFRYDAALEEKVHTLYACGPSRTCYWQLGPRGQVIRMLIASTFLAEWDLEAFEPFLMQQQLLPGGAAQPTLLQPRPLAALPPFGPSLGPHPPPGLQILPPATPSTTATGLVQVEEIQEDDEGWQHLLKAADEELFHC